MGEIAALGHLTVEECARVTYRRLRYIALVGGVGHLAKDGGTLIGSYVTAPLRAWQEGSHPYLRRAILSTGVDPEHVTLSSFIYVHPSYQGRGIAQQMRRNRNTYFNAAGFDYSLHYGAATADLHTWVSKQSPNKIKVPFEDSYSRPCYLVSHG